MTTDQLVQAAVTAAITGYLAWEKHRTFKENKRQRSLERSAGLKDNPKRCTEHADAIRCLDEKMGKLEVDVERLRGDFKALDAKFSAWFYGK
jgi:hypothetical protein